MRLIEPKAPPEHWLQYGLKTHRDVYAELESLARPALAEGSATEFFFMHKAPGLRIRFQAAPGFGDLVTERLAGWQQEGLIEQWRHGVYEPETYLFGGESSMRSVHRVFTADSLAWLGFHRLDAPGPAWAMSLLMIQSLLATLKVVGWEDLDVWDRLRRHGRAAPGALDDPRVKTLAAALRSAWPSREKLAAKLSPEAIALAEEYDAAVREEGPRWFEEYFESGHALIGPREVAAFVIIFHWNRARLPGARQSLLTEALLIRGVEGSV
ncbi:thiopeptide-type bacteriocin biosynthesis protein [Nonomuraea sp. NPDC050310]|uniref:thiopeptide-type bacteriocin biosynthesis protein n=1 Tax=unclassified Nonomuraea TaxID=2593643 RepID=UPI0033F2D7B7